MAKKRTKTKRPSVSRQLQAIIHGCGLSRYEIAKRSGVTQAALSRFMAGERGLSLAAVDRLSDLFDLELTAHGPKPS